MLITMKLKGCAVRSWQAGDRAAVAKYANNRNIWINLRDAFPHPYTVADADRFIAMAMKISPETIFAIDVGGEAVGSIGYRPHEDVERVSAEIGYWLAEPFWNRGIVTQCLKAVTEYAIKTHELTRIYAVPFEWNTASFKVLEKAGYTMDCRLRRSAIKDGKLIDQVLYSYVVD
jgi:RimJ/RimL family protein N-acetyltransferase